MDDLAAFLQRPNNVLIVAIDHGAPVGYIVADLLDRVDRDQQMMFVYDDAACSPCRTLTPRWIPVLHSRQ